MARRPRAGPPLSAIPPTRSRLGALLGILPFIGLAVGVGLIVAWVDLTEVALTLLAARPVGLLIAALLALNATVIVGLKLWMIVRVVEVRRSYAETWSAVMAGLTLNVVLPARGGDLARALFLAREPDTLAILLGAVLLERLFDVATLGALVVVVSVLAGVAVDDPVLWVGLAVVGAASLGGGLLAVLGPKTPFRPDLGERLARAARHSIRHPLWSGGALVLSALAWLNNAALVLVALWAVGATVPILGGLRAAVPALLAGVVPVSVSGIGTRDAVLVVLLGGYATPEQAAAGGLVYTALIYWFLGLIGLFALGRETVRAVRQAARSGTIPVMPWSRPGADSSKEDP